MSRDAIRRKTAAQLTAPCLLNAVTSYSPPSLSFLHAISVPHSSVSHNPSLQLPSLQPPDTTAEAGYRGGAPFHRGTLSRAHTPLIPLPLLPPPPPRASVEISDVSLCSASVSRTFLHLLGSYPLAPLSTPLWTSVLGNCAGCETRAGRRGEGWGNGGA